MGNYSSLGAEEKDNVPFSIIYSSPRGVVPWSFVLMHVCVFVCVKEQNWNDICWKLMPFMFI